MNRADEPAAECAPPLFIVLNPGSGKTDPVETRSIVEKLLNQSEREYALYIVKQDLTLSEAARQAVERAVRCKGVVVAIGGDGTISTVARMALASGCTFGMVPQGTFNYFGRAHGFPEDTHDAMRIVLAGQPCPVQVGLVNGKAFLVNASLGLHPQMLEDREAFTRQFGRSRVVAVWASILTLLRYRRQLRLRIGHHGMERKVHTPTLFVCNNYLQLEHIGIPLTEELARGQLAALMLRPVSLMGMIWLMLRGAVGQLGEARNVVSFSFDRMVVRRPGFYGRRKIKVGMDGEIHECELPLEFRVSPKPLMLLMPSRE